MTERPPCFVIKNNMKNNIQEGFLCVEKDTELGYSINALSEEAVLISLFGVFKENRGKGIGTKFLKEVIEKYGDKKAIIVEVEKPENAKSEEEKTIREKRISFYEKSGFIIYKDINYMIFNNSMYLMVNSSEEIAKEDIIRHMKEIYGRTLRKQFQNMLQIN
ncbi:MAG: GNAT family N-acetyltransferase [Oscillospiraceae bacterium]|nr:GNAT family N-acetyltransferase [Oscillospiraceae bacterium]